jgi:hypothetical protein
VDFRVKSQALSYEVDAKMGAVVRATVRPLATDPVDRNLADISEVMPTIGFQTTKTRQ